MQRCEKCSYTGSEYDHYHIVVEKGKVIEVWYVSGNGCYDRDLEKDEYFVEYREEPKKPWPFTRWKWPSFRKLKPGSEDWLGPKVYKGSANFDAEEEASR